MSKPTVIELSSADAIEAAKAKYWRKHVMRLEREELSRLTGHSIKTIMQFERGYNSRGRPISPKAWKRYWMACAGISHLRQQEARGRALHAWMTAQGYDE